ncbi:unnamed protein product [Agarophyton chilense]
MGKRASSILLALSLILVADAVRFYLEPGQRRCFTEELPSGSKVTGETRVSGGKSDMDIDVWVTNLQGKVLYHKKAPDHGKFSFDTPKIQRQHRPADEYEYEDEEEDTFRICIEHQQKAGRVHPAGTKRAIEFNLDQAFAGASTEGVDRAAKASDTDRLQKSLRRMHTSLSGMIGDMTRLQRRERMLTQKMEETTSHVMVLAILSLFVTVATCAAQYKYYEGYFKQKKLC